MKTVDRQTRLKAAAEAVFKATDELGQANRFRENAKLDKHATAALVESARAILSTAINHMP